MKFRTKIWMLPSTAAILFVVGVAVSFLIGAHTSEGVTQLRTVDDPYLQQLKRIDRAAEQSRLTVQTAVAEGDPDRLGDLKPFVAAVHDALKIISQLDGKAQISRTLGDAFEAQHAALSGAAMMMLGKAEGDKTEAAQRMQATQRSLDAMLAEQLKQARAAIDTRYAEASAGVRQSLIVNVVTGIVVLLALGAASWLIVASVWRELGNEPATLRAQVRRVADGGLAAVTDVDPRHPGSLHAVLAQMARSLGDVVLQIREATDSIGQASTEIAGGNQDLSVRTEQTASNLQQAASAMEELTATVKQTADSALTANGLASSAQASASKGGAVVSQVVATMSAINESSKKIADIIGVIDGIAFQTNILALNAAVEAARAGEQGRGFAVVASEVRNLAQRSAQAAKEIKSLIGASVDKVAAGSRLVDDAGKTMDEIVGNVQRVSDIIGEITAASSEQSDGLGQINEAVAQLDQMTQQNSALVEESAAAAESLKEQAMRLTRSVAVFHVAGARSAA